MGKKVCETLVPSTKSIAPVLYDVKLIFFMLREEQNFEVDIRT